MTDTKSAWLCCFCGDEIDERGPDPCRITVTTAENKPQWWACHGECFKKRLGGPREIFEPQYF
jgi:hypothetical protein